MARVSVDAAEVGTVGGSTNRGIVRRSGEIRVPVVGIGGDCEIGLE